MDLEILTEAGFKFDPYEFEFSEKLPSDLQGVELKPKKELIFFDMTYELIEREKLKANDEDLFKNKKGELSKLSRLRIVVHFNAAFQQRTPSNMSHTYEPFQS